MNTRIHALAPAERTIAVLAILGLFLSSFAYIGMPKLTSAQNSNDFPLNPNVAICHATESDGNPYTNPTVDANSIINLPNGHDDHDSGGVGDGGDIIPPFDYNFGEGTTTYLGKNWDAEGQAIFENECDVDGTITIVKTVDNIWGEADLFEFTVDSDNGGFDDWDWPFGPLLSGNTDVTGDAAPGEYTFTELDTFGWELDDISCSAEGGSEFNYDFSSVTITLAAMDEVECTFYNNVAAAGDEDEDEDENGGGGDDDGEEPTLSCSLSVSEDPVAPGSTFNILWTSTNATSAELSGFGEVALSGSTSTSVTESTVFTLTVEDEQEQMTDCEVTVSIVSSGGGGGGKKIELSDDGDTDEGGSGSSGSDGEPEPEVLGAEDVGGGAGQVSAVPASAPDTGAGGTAGSATSVFIAFVAMLLSALAIRRFSA